MPIQLHKPTTQPMTPAATERPRDRKLRGLPGFVLGLVAVVALIGLVWWLFNWGKMQVKGRVVAAYAELVPKGRCLVDEVYVEVGQTVQKDQLLVKTSSIDPLSQIRTFQAALEAAQSRLALARGGADVGEADLDVRQRRLLTAQQSHDVAVTRLEETRAAERNYAQLLEAARSDRDKEVTKATNDVAVAGQRLVGARASEMEVSVSLAQAKANYDRARTLFDLDAATRRDLDEAQAKFDFATATGDKAKAGVAEASAWMTATEKALESITAKMDADVAAAQARLDQARAATEQAQVWEKSTATDLEAARRQYGSTPAAQDPAARELELLQHRVDEAKGNLDYYRGLAGALDFLAPFAGKVGSINKKKGDVADPLEVVISVYNTETIYIEAFVPEEDYWKLEKAKEAYVRVPGMGSAARFRGEVKHVNRKPTRLPGELKAPVKEGEYARRYVSVRIELKDPKLREMLTPDMTAEVTIYTR